MLYSILFAWPEAGRRGRGWAREAAGVRGRRGSPSARRAGPGRSGRCWRPCPQVGWSSCSGPPARPWRSRRRWPPPRAARTEAPGSAAGGPRPPHAGRRAAAAERAVAAPRATPPRRQDLSPGRERPASTPAWSRGPSSVRRTGAGRDRRGWQSPPAGGRAPWRRSRRPSRRSRSWPGGSARSRGAWSPRRPRSSKAYHSKSEDSNSSNSNSNNSNNINSKSTVIVLLLLL